MAMDESGDEMYSFDGRIRYSETDAKAKIAISSIIDYFQDCSSFQSEDLGIGLGYMKQHHVGWVINYWQINVLRYPGLGEAVRTTTSPYELKGFMGLRNFKMETQEGELLAVANSVWSLIDTSIMHPTRIPDEIVEKYELHPKFDMEYTPRKIRMPKVQGISKPSVTVQEFHLDTNHHMNNGQYVKIASALLPEGEVEQIRIAYLKQAVLGDMIFPTLYRDGDVVTVVLDCADGKPYAILEARMR